MAAGRLGGCSKQASTSKSSARRVKPVGFIPVGGAVGQALMTRFMGVGYAIFPNAGTQRGVERLAVLLSRTKPRVLRHPLPSFPT